MISLEGSYEGVKYIIFFFFVDVTDSDSCGSDEDAILDKYCPIASKNRPVYVQYVDILSYSTLLFFVSVVLYVSFATRLTLL